MELSSQIQTLVQKRMKIWLDKNMASRLWQKDPCIWKENPEEQVELANRLGWLNIIEQMQNKIKELKTLVEDVCSRYDHVILLGMGGSSLAPEVFFKTFGNKKGYPDLKILDSTHPQAVQNILDNYPLTKTLFLVSSKSGGTIETISFYKFFYSRLQKKTNEPGRHFIALTDAGSGLEKIAREKGFFEIFNTPEDVGGRFSALTYYGLLPAALIGMDLELLLKEALVMKNDCSPSNPVDKNPGFILGAALGEMALQGKDKVSFIISPAVASFGDWIEQLIAESTGKEGKGILPVTAEDVLGIEYFGDDRVFVYLRLEHDDNKELDRFVEKLKKDNRPVISIRLKDKYDLGGEFFRWEMTTAMIGEVLKIHPFNQPDVQLAKTLAAESLQAYKKDGQLPQSTPVYNKDNISVFGASAGAGIKEIIHKFFSSLHKGDYIAIMGFIPPSDEVDRLLREFANGLLKKYHVPVTTGYGPRFLHSTGQLHKGGKNNGYFVQITCEPEEDFEVADAGYSFNVLISAQAQGDMQALINRGRKVIRFHIHGRMVDGLKKLLH
jgi:transaldolase/glucose-6-phosphate isomerase